VHKKEEIREKRKDMPNQEGCSSYMANFGIKNDDIGGEKTYFQKESSYFSKQ